jgi:DNA-binding LacI/PurR family transcriptional regulator
MLRQVEEKGYHLVLQMTPWKDAQSDLDCLNSLLHRGVDGIVFVGSGLTPGNKLYDYFLAEKYPIVNVQRTPPALSAVRSEWTGGFEEAVSYLKDKGHQRIGFYRQILEDDPKLPAFLAACWKYQVEGIEYNGGSDATKAVEDIRVFVQDLHRPSALIVCSDYTATGVLLGLRRAGVEVPNQIAVVGIDGTQAGGLTCPPLTTIAQDIPRITGTAVDMVINLIEKKEEPGRQVEIPTRLIVRESA